MLYRSWTARLLYKMYAIVWVSVLNLYRVTSSARHLCVVRCALYHGPRQILYNDSYCHYLGCPSDLSVLRRVYKDIALSRAAVVAVACCCSVCACYRPSRRYTVRSYRPTPANPSLFVELIDNALRLFTSSVTCARSASASLTLLSNVSCC